MSVVGAFLPFPPLFGYDPSPGADAAGHSETTAMVLHVVAIASAALGVYMAYLWFFKKPRLDGDEMITPLTTRGLRRFWHEGWGFDRVYGAVFIRPFEALARVMRSDLIDVIYRFIAGMAHLSHLCLRATQTGRLRWYAAGLAVGAVITLSIVVFS
jgi:NADH-quinone oxidoreductase subunit L